MDPENLSEGFHNTDNDFFMRGERIQIPLKRVIIGPPAKRHLNGVSLAGRWWPKNEYWLGSLASSQVSGVSITKETYSFVIFQGRWVRTPSPSSGSARVVLIVLLSKKKVSGELAKMHRLTRALAACIHKV